VRQGASDKKTRVSSLAQGKNNGVVITRPGGSPAGRKGEIGMKKTSLLKNAIENTRNKLHQEHRVTCE